MNSYADMQMCLVFKHTQRKKSMICYEMKERFIFLQLKILTISTNHKLLSDISSIWSEIKIIVYLVPHLKCLAAEDLLKFEEENSNIKYYLPEDEYQKQTNRQWLFNILNTLLRDKFVDFVKEKMRERVKHASRKKEYKREGSPWIRWYIQ